MFPLSEGPACWVPAPPMAGGRWDAWRRHRSGLKQAVPGRRPRPSLAVSSEFSGDVCAMSKHRLQIEHDPNKSLALQFKKNKRNSRLDMVQISWTRSLSGYEKL